MVNNTVKGESTLVTKWQVCNLQPSNSGISSCYLRVWCPSLSTQLNLRSEKVAIRTWHYRRAKSFTPHTWNPSSPLARQPSSSSRYSRSPPILTGC